MAKSDRLRDQEREIETEAAYASEAKGETHGEEDFMIPEEKELDDIAVANRIVSEAKDEGGASGPGISGGEHESTY